MLFKRLLDQTSRTFALSIPMLPAPLDHEVSITYLLMRLADTFEDSTHAPIDRRTDGLTAFCTLMRDPTNPAALDTLRQAADDIEVAAAGERALFDDCATLFDAFAVLRPAARDVIARTCIRMAEGMAMWIARTDDDGVLRMNDLADLRAYCEVVAGIVGDMLTELFLIDRPEMAPVADDLRARAYAFGEGIQLVNIVKDAAVDAKEGRVYLPASEPIAVILDLARTQMQQAREYVELLEKGGAPDGIVQFNRITLELATAALDATERDGLGARLTRPEVARILDGAHA